MDQVHSISPAGDGDWFAFSLNSLSDVVIATSGPSGDTILGLLAADAMTILDTNDDYVAGWSRISRRLDSGTYYALVGAYNNTTEIPSYTMSLTVTQVLDSVIIAVIGVVVVVGVVVLVVFFVRRRGGKAGGFLGSISSEEIRNPPAR